MKDSRRSFITKAAVAPIALGLTATDSAIAKEKKACPTMVGACGLSCQVCPLMKAGKCQGCGPGTSNAAKKKSCPVLKCASMKKVAYCGTDCPGFTKCAKLIGKPYDKDFMDSIKRRLG